MLVFDSRMYCQGLCSLSLGLCARTRTARTAPALLQDPTCGCEAYCYDSLCRLQIGFPQTLMFSFFHRFGYRSLHRWIHHFSSLAFEPSCVHRLGTHGLGLGLKSNEAPWREWWPKGGTTETAQLTWWENDDTTKQPRRNEEKTTGKDQGSKKRWTNAGKNTMKHDQNKLKTDENMKKLKEKHAFLPFPPLFPRPSFAPPPPPPLAPPLPAPSRPGRPQPNHNQNHEGNNPANDEIMI